MSDKLQERTIADFGEQWTKYTENRGYYASVELLKDVFGPLLDIKSLAGRRVAEIGAGTGRFIRLLSQAGASSVLAVNTTARITAFRPGASPPPVSMPIRFNR